MEGVARAVKKETEAEDVAPSPQPRAGLHDAGPPPFLTKTFEMVEDPATNAVVSWTPARNSFVVWDANTFAATLLPKYFKHSNFSSFIRQLNTYGFRKVDPDRWEFANERFLRGQKHLLKDIRRRRNAPSGVHAHQGLDTCVELGQFGLETEVARLRRDRTTLMLEIVKLRQQQEHSRGQLLAVAERLQGTERRQRQMMGFLARALRNPSFVRHLTRRQEQRKLLEGTRKKRRLPANAGPEGLPGFDTAAVEPEIETLLSSMDEEACSSSSRGCESGPSMGVGDPDLWEVNDVAWEEILNEGLLADDAVDDEVQSEIDVEIEGLPPGPGDWGVDVTDLVEQMRFMQPKP